MRSPWTEEQHGPQGSCGASTVSGEGSRKIDSKSSNQRGYRIEEGKRFSWQAMAAPGSSRELGCKPVPGRREMKGREPWASALAGAGQGQGLGRREGKSREKLP